MILKILKDMASDDSDNAVKYFLFHFETGAKVCFHVLNWLYQGKGPIECFVGDLTCFKKIILNGDEEKKMVDELENGTIEICDLNLTLLYKITRSICGLLRNDKEHNKLWSKNCPSNEKAELEHLIFLLDAGQNSAKHKTITKSDLEPILQKAGQRGDIDVQEINKAITEMHDYYEVIYNDDTIDGLTKYSKCGSYVINTILSWLYQGQSSIKDLAIDLTKMKTIQIDDTQKDVLYRLRNKNIKLSDLDISFLFKIIQSVCGLAEGKEGVWKKQDELEFLILKLKNSRNDVAHRFLEFKNMTDSDLEVKSDEMKSLLTSIIERAGQKSNNIDVQKVRDAVTFVEKDIERIRNKDKINAYMKSRILEQILRDLKFSYKAELRSSYENEFKGYSVPNLRSDNSKSKIDLRDLLTFEESQIIVVQGEAGEGKTSLTKFLYNSWLSENKDNTNIMEGLSSFEVVLRVDCNQIFSSDIIPFYEKSFPIASSAFPKKGSLKKYFDEFKVLWIMDGFNECTTEFKGFLTAMTNSLSEKHKLLITTRPHTYEDLKGYIGETSMTSLALELLQERNVEEIIQSLIMEDEKKENFKTYMSSLHKSAKLLLRTPLNLSLCIKLWKQDSELVTNIFTPKMLFLKTIYHYLSLLPKRLDKHSDLSSDELKDSLKDWFYGSLCKQSFLMLMQNRLNFISIDDLKTLKKDARKFTQNTSMCLSTFLIQVKKYDWEDKGEFKYEFHHLTQQFILASLFLKHFKDYDGENVINSISTEFGNINVFINFYVEMINEDGSLDTNSTQVFSPIQSIINSIDIIEPKSFLWISSSAASHFNVKYMEKVSQAFKDIPYLYINGYIYNCMTSNSLNLTHFTKFLEFVHPQKIKLSNLGFIIKQDNFQPLLEILIKSHFEIEFKTKSTILEIPFLSSDDVFCGTFDNFLELRKNEKKWAEELKTICINVLKLDLEFYNFYFETLKEYKALERIEIWINLDSISLPTNIIKIPTKEMVEITTIGLIGLNIEDFEKVLEVLNKVKGRETLKFKALHHDYKYISETGKRHLQKMAQTVSIDFICQCKKDYYISKMFKLNITSFKGDIQMLNALNTHHDNLNSVSLSITHKWELCRTLKFLHDYKANLNNVKIKLFDRFPELINPENRTSANFFTIPQELVQRTSIFIPKLNLFDDILDISTLLNKLKGDKSLKFKAVYTDNTSLKHHQLEIIRSQITGNSSCEEDFDNDSQRYLIQLSFNGF